MIKHKFSNLVQHPYHMHHLSTHVFSHEKSNRKSVLSVEWGFSKMSEKHPKSYLQIWFIRMAFSLLCANFRIQPVSLISHDLDHMAKNQVPDPQYSALRLPVVSPQNRKQFQFTPKWVKQKNSQDHFCDVWWGMVCEGCDAILVLVIDGNWHTCSTRNQLRIYLDTCLLVRR